MYKFLILFLLVAVTANRKPEGVGRFLAATRTSTVIVLSTTTIPSVVRKTCWTQFTPDPFFKPNPAAITLCRRRRGIEEEPEIIGLRAPLEIIKPSQSVPFQATTLPSIQFEKGEVDIERNTEIDSSTQEEIADTENYLLRSAFGFTVYFRTSITVVITSFSKSTSGSTVFALDKCIPSELEKEKC